MTNGCDDDLFSMQPFELVSDAQSVASIDLPVLWFLKSPYKAFAHRPKHRPTSPISIALFARMHFGHVYLTVHCMAIIIVKCAITIMDINFVGINNG